MCMIFAFSNIGTSTYSIFRLSLNGVWVFAIARRIYLNSTLLLIPFYPFRKKFKVQDLNKQQKCFICFTRLPGKHVYQLKNN